VGKKGATHSLEVVGHGLGVALLGVVEALAKLVGVGSGDGAGREGEEGEGDELRQRS
jgi:hypothetical protein